MVIAFCKVVITVRLPITPVANVGRWDSTGYNMRQALRDETHIKGECELTPFWLKCIGHLTQNV